MVFILFVLSVTVTIAGSIITILKIRYRYWQNRNVPHLKTQSFFENFRHVSKARYLKDAVHEAYRNFRGQTPLAGIYIYSYPFTIVLDLDLVQRIFIRDFSKFRDRGLYYNERDDPLSANLLTLDGEKWKSLRSKLTPTFTSGKMKFMFLAMLDVMKQLDNAVENILHQQNEIEIKELLARFTTDTIGTCAFGIECNSLNDPKTEFCQMGRMAFEAHRHGTIERLLLVMFPDLARKLRVKNTRDDVSDFFMNLVRQTVEYRERNKAKRNDFMDILLELKNSRDVSEQISFEEVAAQSYLFFLAGFETSSTNMTYSLYELAMNEDIQERARDEIEEVLERHGGQFTYDAMMEMEYIDRIGKESLRKYPPIPILMRISNCDYPVNDTDIVIEKSSRVLIPVYSIHHDPDIYPDPEIFDPDRFLQEQLKRRHPMAFLTLGQGPRNCIGARFGQMQSRIGLVALLRNYRFKASQHTPPILEFADDNPILIPKHRLWLRVEKIHRNKYSVVTT